MARTSKDGGGLVAIGARKKPSLAKGIAETLGVQELCIAVGAATYWSTTALLCIAWNGGHAAAGPASFLEQGLSHAAACAAIGVAFALSAKMLERRFQMGLLGVGIVSALCGLVAQVFAGQGAKAFSTIVLGVHSGCFIVFWGLNFIDLNKSEANKTVLLTGVLTMAFYACGQFFPEGLRTFGTALALRLLGVAPFLLGAYRLSLIRSSVDSGRWRFLAGFALNRVAFDLCNGCLVFVTTLVPLTIAGSSWASASVLLVVLGAAATFSFSERGRKNTNGFLVVMPLVFACFFSCGPLLRHDSSFGPVALVVCWLSWIMLGSTEMSDVKERVGGQRGETGDIREARFYGDLVSWVRGKRFGPEALLGRRCRRSSVHRRDVSGSADVRMRSAILLRFVVRDEQQRAQRDARGHAFAGEERQRRAVQENSRCVWPDEQRAGSALPCCKRI